jgi:hypothetical protein
MTADLAADGTSVEDGRTNLAEGLALFFEDSDVEIGDLCIPIANGDLMPDDIIADLAEAVAGAVVRRARLT